MIKNLPPNARDSRDSSLILGSGDVLEEEMALTPVFLPGKSHGQMSLVGYSPWGHKESDMTEQLTEHNEFTYILHIYYIYEI